MCILLQLAHAPFAEASVRSGTSILLLSPRPTVRESGSSATTRRFETKAPSAEVCYSRQIVLGNLAAALAGMETSVDSCPARDRCSLASGRIQVVLDLALAASKPRGKKMRPQRIARTHLPHGCREPDLGRAANSRGIEDAGLRYFGANGVALDEKSAEGS